MIKVGFCTVSMSLAMVYVFPVPVAPSNTCAHSPRSIPSAKDWMAFGWSPIGE